jgi:hypothetical protein
LKNKKTKTPRRILLPLGVSLLYFSILARLGLDFDIDAGCDWKYLELVDGVQCWVEKIEHPHVGSHLELLARLAVDVRRSENGVDLSFGRQGNWPYDSSACSFCRFNDVLNRSIKGTLIKGLQTDPDFFSR